VEVNATSLRLKKSVGLPLEAEAMTPDRIAGLRQADVAALPVLLGRHWATVGDLFVVEGDGTEEIVLQGDLRHVKRIGQGMSRGRISVHGNVGLHLGSFMRGGEIVVHGDADAWAGAHMSGGLIRIHGDAGPMLGGAYVGERRGMCGGVILVTGNAGIRAGERMRRGLIAVGGCAGEFAGVEMIAGSLIVFGRLGPRAGAGMKRGTILALGGLEHGLPPTFRHACHYRPTFLRLYLGRLKEWGLPVTAQHLAGSVDRYVGDITTLGKGEILVYDQH
jgi:formylmethanofuran dehydrogenase subunit C